MLKRGFWLSPAGRVGEIADGFTAVAAILNAAAVALGVVCAAGGGIGHSIANSSSAPTATANRDSMCDAMVLPCWRDNGIIAGPVRNLRWRP